MTRDSLNLTLPSGQVVVATYDPADDRSKIVVTLPDGSDLPEDQLTEADRDYVLDVVGAKLLMDRGIGTDLQWFTAQAILDQVHSVLNYHLSLSDAVSQVPTKDLKQLIKLIAEFKQIINK